MVRKKAISIKAQTMAHSRGFLYCISPKKIIKAQWHKQSKKHNNNNNNHDF
jgi:hypothetical protein